VERKGKEIVVLRADNKERKKKLAYRVLLLWLPVGCSMPIQKGLI